MPTQINGLPAHVLLIHIVIVFVPLASIALVLHAAWPVARRRLGVVTPLLALVALVMVPVTTNAGEWLEDRLNAPKGSEFAERIEHHAELGDTLLPLVIVLFVAAAALWFGGRRYEFGLTPDRRRPDVAVDGAPSGGGVATAVRTQPQTATRLPTWASVVITLVAVVIAVVNIVQLVRIGDAGAQAVWNGVG